jgi:predicted RNA-binding protein with RPS1 domain
MDSEIEGEIKNITEFGLFVGLDGDIDGMVHLSDIDWSLSGEEAVKNFKKGDVIRAKVLDVDTEKERISLGIKQLGADPFASALESVKKGDTVTCTVSRAVENGIEVTVAGSLHGFIRRSDLSRERSEQRPDRFAAGDRLDALVTNIDRKDRRLTLSIKAHEVKEEKQAMAEYGSSDSGASLGDILGAAISRANEEREGEGTDPDGDDSDADEGTDIEASAPSEPDEDQAAEPQATADEAEPEEAEPEEAVEAAEPEVAEPEEAVEAAEPEVAEPEEASDTAEPETAEDADKTAS